MATCAFDCCFQKLHSPLCSSSINTNKDKKENKNNDAKKMRFDSPIKASAKVMPLPPLQSIRMPECILNDSDYDIVPVPKPMSIPIIRLWTHDKVNQELLTHLYFLMSNAWKEVKKLNIASSLFIVDLVYYARGIHYAGIETFNPNYDKRRSQWEYSSNTYWKSINVLDFLERLELEKAYIICAMFKGDGFKMQFVDPITGDEVEDKR